MFPSQVMVLELSKKVYFLQFCGDISKKSESKQIYIYASESSHDTHSENGMVCRSLTAIYELLVIKISKEMLTQQKLIIDFIHRLQTLISLKQQVAA